VKNGKNAEKQEKDFAGMHVLVLEYLQASLC